MTTYNPCRFLVHEHERWIEHVKEDWYHEALERGVYGEQYFLIQKKRLRYPLQCLAQANQWREEAYKKSQMIKLIKDELVETAFHENRIFGWDEDTFDMMVGD